VLLETDRLRLREFEASDADALEAVLGDEETMKFYPHAFSREEVEAWIARWRDRYFRDGFGLWAMILKETEGLIGDCGLITQDVDGVVDVEVGWHVRRDLWRQGLATEAATACVELAFTKLGLPRVISLIRPENIASRRVAEKLGMKVWRQTIRGEKRWIHDVFLLEAP
jgi:[ribosomal protein S5]-alanine N-acetyltransferase